MNKVRNVLDANKAILSVGDKVKCIDPGGNNLRRGEIFIITKLESHPELTRSFNIIYLADKSGGYWAHRFVKVVEEPNKMTTKKHTLYSPGDKIWVEFTVHRDNVADDGVTVVLDLRPTSVCYDNSGIEVGLERVKKHIPAPNLIVVGSIVTDQSVTKTRYRVEGISSDGLVAWVRHNSDYYSRNVADLRVIND